jgi:hypothetical protein
MLLPPCPLRLQTSFVWKNQLVGVLLLLIGIAASLGYAWWQYDAVRELIEQTGIWQAGVPAAWSEVKGEVTTNRFIFRGYDLDVTYLDAQGARHQGKLKFDTLGGAVDQKRDPVVHYLKDAPDRFALSWSMDVRTSRWVSVGFMALVGIGLVGGSFSYLGWLALRRLADARRCAARSDEVIVRITKVVPQMVQGRHTGNTIHFAGVTVDGREVAGKMVLAKKYEPLYADPSLQTMVALVPPENPKRAVVLRSDFHPFLLTTEEQAQVRAAIARSTPAHG